MPGDLPCNAPCSWRWCRWWSDGHCMDNDTCESVDWDAEMAEALCDAEADNDNENETEDNR